MASKTIINVGVLLVCVSLLSGCRLMAWKPVPLKTFPAAVTMVGSSSRIFSDTGSLSISGGSQTEAGGAYHGYTATGTPDKFCTGRAGIATEAKAGPYRILRPISGGAQSQDMANCPYGACVQITGAGLDAITGSTGKTLDIVHKQTQFTIEDAHKLWEMKTEIDSASETFESPELNAQTPHLGTMEEPKIVHVKGNARVTGNVSGAGILFVEGDLEISGKLDWQGIVMVGACYHCYGFLKGVGQLKVNGALVLSKDLDAGSLFSGTTDIRYSCAAIRRAQKE
jgi:hypothetical protein